MFNKIIYPALFSLLFITACDSNNLETLIEDQIEDSNGDPEIDQSFAAEATRLTNLVRAVERQCGNNAYDQAPALQWNDQLAEAALAHSQDMAANNYFDHTNQAGENPGVRVARTGYVASTWGENIAAGYGSLDRVMEGWVDSPGHCANIMNGRFTELGLAFAESSNSTYGIYWTMVLATPR